MIRVKHGTLWKKGINRFSLMALLGIISCSPTKPFIAPSALKSAETAANYPLESIRTRLLLIGDAGAPECSADLLAKLKSWALQAPERTTIVFLGDNVYPHGIPGTASYEARTRLATLMSIPLQSGCGALFIPGNHDWGRHDDRAALLREQEVVTHTLGENSFLPRDGCCGPALRIENGVHMIVFDAQRFMKKQADGDSSCAQRNLREFAAAMRESIGGAGNGHIILLAHHPLATYGSHNGYHAIREHLFPLTVVKPWLWVPLPVLGSLFWGARYLIPGTQSLRAKQYALFIDTMKNVLDEYQGAKRILYAAGHDHNLQIIDWAKPPLTTIVAGGGSRCKIRPVRHGKDTRFAHAHAGFAVLDYLDNDETILRLVEDTGEEALFTVKLY